MLKPHRRQAFPSPKRADTLKAATVAAGLALSAIGALAQRPPASATSASAGASSAAMGMPSVPSGPCLLMFGQGRNYDAGQPAMNRRWDEANAAFALAAREPLVAAGLPVINVVLPVAATDLPRNLQGLLAEVQRRGCTRVLETAVFADTAQGVLIARLRVYPVLGMLGPQAAGPQPRIGAIAYTQQKEYALDARLMDRVDPSRLGRIMAEEALPNLAPPGSASR